MNYFASRMTPINDSYPTCSLAYASLIVYPNELDTDSVTKLLELIPTESQNKGDRTLTKKGTIRTSKLNYWSFSTEGSVHSLDIRTHLDWLLNEIIPASNAIKLIQNTNNTKMFINCVWWSRSGDGGPTLWPEQMKIMYDLNLECSFSIGFYE